MIFEIGLLFSNTRIVGDPNGKRLVFALYDRVNTKVVSSPSQDMPILCAPARLPNGKEEDGFQKVRFAPRVVTRYSRFVFVEAKLGLLEIPEIRELESR